MCTDNIRFTVFLSDWDNENTFTCHVNADNPVEAADIAIKKATKECNSECSARLVIYGWHTNLLGLDSVKDDVDYDRAPSGHGLPESEYGNIAKKLDCKHGCTTIEGRAVQPYFEGDLFSHFYCNYCGDSVSCAGHVTWRPVRWKILTVPR